MNTTTDTSLQFSKQNTRGKIFKILNLSVPILMGIFIFFNPFPHTTSIKEICFYGSVIIVLILIYFKKIDFSFKSPLTLPFALFVIWVFIGLFFALDKENSLHDFRAHLLKYLVLYYILINFFNSRKSFEILSWIIIISGGIFSIGGIIYFYVISGNHLSARLGLPEVGIGVNYIGFFTIVAIFFSLTHLSIRVNLYLKITSMICVLASSVATILTGTRGAFLGLILPLVLLFPRNKKTLTVFALIFLVILCLTPVKHILMPGNLIKKIQGDDRKNIWYTYLEVIKDHPIAGIGYGMQTYNKSIIDKYEEKIPRQFKMQTFFAPHNTFIDVTVRLGIVGLALFLFIAFIFGRMGWQLIRYGRDDFIKTWALCLTATFVSFLIQGMFVDLLLGIQIIIFFILMAMLTVLWRLNEEQEDRIQLRA